VYQFSAPPYVLSRGSANTFIGVSNCHVKPLCVISKRGRNRYIDRDPGSVGGLELFFHDRGLGLGAVSLSLHLAKRLVREEGENCGSYKG
jgi:hypothetical protein